MSILITALLLASSPVLASNWTQVESPLSPANEEQIYCENPDHVAKTCEAFATYTFADDGSITGQAQAALNNDPFMYFTLNGKAEIKGREICTTVAREDIDGIKLFLGDGVFDAEQSAQIETMVRDGLTEQLLGKVVCERHFIDGDRRMSTAWIDGVETPDLAGEYAWIEKDAGYRLFTAEPLF